MPNYSKSRTLFTSKNKSIDDIPWTELRSIYAEAHANLLEEAQAKIDLDYAEEIAEKEQAYTDSHEAPYEGNFSDQLAKPVAYVSEAKLYKTTQEQASHWIEKKYSLGTHIDWIMPQLITLVGRMPVSRNENGLISGLRFRNNNFNTDKLKGIYRFLMFNERSSFLKLQYKPPASKYCVLIPLILYAVKLVQGIEYSQWDRDEIKYVVHSDLSDAMLYEGTFTKDEVMEQRTLGLTSVDGKLKPAQTTHMLYGPHLKTGVFADVPRLARVMYTQIWCAHPSNRTRYMVLNPANWDKIPPALISTDVVEVEVAPMEVHDGWV